MQIPDRPQLRASGRECEDVVVLERCGEDGSRRVARRPREVKLVAGDSEGVGKVVSAGGKENVGSTRSREQRGLQRLGAHGGIHRDDGPPGIGRGLLVSGDGDEFCVGESIACLSRWGKWGRQFVPIAGAAGRATRPRARGRPGKGHLLRERVSWVVRLDWIAGPEACRRLGLSPLLRSGARSISVQKTVWEWLAAVQWSATQAGNGDC